MNEAHVVVVVAQRAEQLDKERDTNAERGTMKSAEMRLTRMYNSHRLRDMDGNEKVLQRFDLGDVDDQKQHVLHEAAHVEDVEEPVTVEERVEAVRAARGAEFAERVEDIDCGESNKEESVSALKMATPVKENPWEMFVNVCSPGGYGQKEKRVWELVGDEKVR